MPFINNQFVTNEEWQKVYPPNRIVPDRDKVEETVAASAPVTEPAPAELGPRRKRPRRVEVVEEQQAPGGETEPSIAEIAAAVTAEDEGSIDDQMDALIASKFAE